MAPDLQFLVLNAHLRIAEETGSYRLVALPNKACHRLGAQVHSLNQIVASIEGGVIEDRFDNRPHLVSSAEIVGCGKHSKRRGAEIEPHFQSI